MSVRGGVLTRGTSNGNSRGSAEDRRRRRAYLVDRDGWRLPDGTGLVLCYRCHVVLLEHDDPEAPGQAVTVDRIVPGCEGGRYTRDNIRAACAGCNSETGGALARGPRSTHARTHAALSGYVTHATTPAHTGVRDNGDESTHDHTHATHGPRAVTSSPPSTEGEA